MAWQLTAGLQNLRAQVNARWPHRDKASDGTIGDAAHQAETSGHNPDGTPGSRPEYDDHDGKAEVRAWDMDSDLGEPGTTAQMVVDHLRSLPGLDAHIRYMIYNRRIYKAATGWAPEVYSGSSPHTEHIHFSGARSQAADNDSSFDYRLEEIGMSLANERIEITKSSQALFAGAKVGDTQPASAWLSLAAIYAQRAAVAGQAAAATLQQLVARDDVDEQALATALIPGLTAAIVEHLPAGTLTAAQVEDAVRAVLRSGVGG